MTCAVGNTPLIVIDDIFAKLECGNPTGSIKDRMVHYVLTKSEEQGLLKKGMTIVEATSGNTGISLAYFGRMMGHRVILVMPENMSAERKSIIINLGAELVLCDAGDFAMAARIRDELVADKGYFTTDQFANPLNVECHYMTTGREILRQFSGRTIDAFVAGVGTGGTLVGIGRALREKFPQIYLAAAEPAESPVLSGGRPGIHSIQGIGDGFIPAIVSGKNGRVHGSIDEVISVPSADAIEAAKYLSTMGACVGVSSGANYLAALDLAGRFSTVVTVFPDGYFKYVSQGLSGNADCEYRKCCACELGPERL